MAQSNVETIIILNSLLSMLVAFSGSFLVLSKKCLVVIYIYHPLYFPSSIIPWTKARRTETLIVSQHPYIAYKSGTNYPCSKTVRRIFDFLRIFLEFVLLVTRGPTRSDYKKRPRLFSGYGEGENGGPFSNKVAF